MLMLPNMNYTIGHCHRVIEQPLNCDASVLMFDAPKPFPLHRDFVFYIMDDWMYAKWSNNFVMKSHYPKCYAQMMTFEWQSHNLCLKHLLQLMTNCLLY